MLNILDYRGRRRMVAPHAAAIWPLLEDGVLHNLEQTPIPDPYTSGVVYRREQRLSGPTPDTFLPWWKVRRVGSGDCEDLSAWAAARYRLLGDSTARVGLVEFPGGGWHAVVLTARRPSNSSDSAVWRVESARYHNARVYAGPDVGWDPPRWWVIDPSFSLGMRDPAARTLYHPQTTDGEREGVGAPPEEQETPKRRLLIPVAIGALATAALVYGLTQHPVDYTGPLPWRSLWGRYPGFETAIRSVARQLGTDPRFILAVMRKESNFDSRIQNGYGYTGLIQFGPEARQELGISNEQLLATSPAGQVELARRYWWPYRGKLSTLADLYMATFLPSRLGQQSSIIAREGQLRYSRNKTLDVNRDGVIEYWEPGAEAARLLQEEEERMRAAGELPAATPAAPAVAAVGATAELAEREQYYQSQAAAAATVGKLVDILTLMRADPLVPAALHGIIERRIGYLMSPQFQGTVFDARPLVQNIIGQLTQSRSFDPTTAETVRNMATAVYQAPAAAVQLAAEQAERIDAGMKAVSGFGVWPWLALAGAGLIVWRMNK